MTTVALEVLIDASRMPQGAQQVEQSLTRVNQAADKTATSMANVGRATSAAFQVTGGSVQIAQGIAQTAMSFDKLNISAAAFGASRTLLEVGRTVQDFQSLRGAVGGATSVMGVLGVAIRSNPIGAIATGIGLAATAMSLFGTNTSKAAKDWDALAQAIRQANAEDATSSLVGGPGGSSGRLGAIRSAITASRLANESVSLLQFAESTGISPTDVLRGFNGQNATASEYLRTGKYTQARTAAERAGRAQTFPRAEFPGHLEISPAQQQDMLSRYYRGLQSEQRQVGEESAGFYQFGAAQGRSDFSMSPDNNPYFVGQSANDRFQVEQERIDAASKRQIEAAERVADVLGQAGSELGQALFSAIQGGTGSLRAALANLLTQQAGRGFAGAFEIAGRAVAGLSAGQAAPRTPGVNP